MNNNEMQDGFIASREANERFTELVQQEANRMTAAGVDPETGVPADPEHAAMPVAPKPEALAAVSAAQAAKGEDGTRPYAVDSDYRARVFAASTAAQAGQSLAAVRAILDGTPDQQAPQPTASPADQLTHYLDNGGTVAQQDVLADTWSTLTAGYAVNLPSGYVLSGEHVEMLQNAKRAGVTQDVVDRYVREALKG